ncbi:flagellar basal-body MS-ring/collar protein FliF [Pseudolysinimonas sp.]|uniref:flagellar basal-body MS-ring/collar protein FliF n=1 Tax=Pseudolysinimonas sp. TaxID=2680009 RepID=UPI003F7DB6A3
MPARVQSALGRLIAVIREFTVAQRTLAIIGTVGVVVGAIALGAWLMKPTYSPLFSGLSGTDASAIVEQLKTDGVDYQLADGGSTILVPEANVDKERLAAAAAGLPGDKTAGYSLLDNMGVTSSEFQQTVTYKRALEGELSKTIEGLDGVRTASVKLAIPQQTVFVSDKANPTASVFLDLKPGVTLGKEQVKAVTHLVSASVDGMSPDDVAVVDADGQVLSSVGGQQADGTASVAGDYETKTAAAIQSMLDKVVGVGNATVVVTADVSQESAQRTQETYSTPNGSPAYSESVQQSGSTSGSGSGSGSGQAGVLGPDNIAVPNGTSGTTAGGSGQSSTVRDNAVDKTVETRTIPAGELTKQAVSVAVNSDKVKVPASTISSMVAAAAGIDKQRGDVVSVQKVSFAKAAAADAKSAIAGQQSAESDQNMTQIITTGIIAGAVVLGLFLVLTVLMRAGRRRAEQTALALGELEVNPLLPPDSGAPAVVAGAQPGRLDAAPAPASIAPAPEPLPVEIGGVDRVRASVEALAGSDPERTAEYLRSLMDDRQPA